MLRLPHSRGVGRRARWSLTLLLVVTAADRDFISPGLNAQEPTEARPVESLIQDEIPVMPEMVVPGRAAAFPANPLDADTVVTPERSATGSGTSGSSVTVITGEEMRARGQSSVLEALRGSAGLDVVQSGGVGRPTSVFLRGANSEHTKVLLDGIPLNNPADPTRRFDFSTLTVDNIERVEIVRGPQSVVYGSDAIGGVINIVTKRGDGPSTARLTVLGGSFGTHEERVAVQGGDETRYYSLGASSIQTNGFSAVSRRFGATEPDGYQNATVSGRFGWNVADGWNVDYVFRYSEAEVDVDGFDNFTFLPADELNRQNLHDQFFQRVQLQSLAWDGILENKVGFSLTDFAVADTNPGLFGQPRFDGQGRQVDWQSNVQISDSHVFTAGVDYFAEDASPFNGGLQRQNLSSLYLQDRFDLWEVSHTSFGVRWDDHSVAGQAETYRVSQSLDVQATGGRLHGSLGRGFRAPAISQRFGGVGNPNLRPEFSKGWDFGFEQPLFDGTLVWDTTYFRNDFSDLIVFVAGPFGPFGFGELRNVQAARTSGVETSLGSQLTETVYVAANYTYTDTLDLSNNSYLVRRPRNKVGLTMRLDVSDRAVVNAYLLYVGNRPDFDAFGAIVSLEDYVTLNLSGTYRLNDRWELFGRLDNITDTDYEEVFAFATAGVAGYAGLNFQW